MSSKDKEPEHSKSSSITKETEDKDNVPERKISAASREGEEVVDSTEDAESSKNSSSRRGSRDTDKQLGGVDIDSSDTKSEISVDSAGEDGKLKSRKLEKSRSKDDLDDKKKKRRVPFPKFLSVLKLFIYLIWHLYIYTVCINITRLRFIMFCFSVSCLTGIFI